MYGHTDKDIRAVKLSRWEEIIANVEAASQAGLVGLAASGVIWGSSKGMFGDRVANAVVDFESGLPEIGGINGKALPIVTGAVVAGTSWLAFQNKSRYDAQKEQLEQSTEINWDDPETQQFLLNDNAITWEAAKESGVVGIFCGVEALLELVELGITFNQTDRSHSIMERVGTTIQEDPLSSTLFAMSLLGVAGQSLYTYAKSNEAFEDKRSKLLEHLREKANNAPGTQTNLTEPDGRIAAAQDLAVNPFSS